MVLKGGDWSMPKAQSAVVALLSHKLNKCFRLVCIKIKATIDLANTNFCILYDFINAAPSKHAQQQQYTVHIFSSFFYFDPFSFLHKHWAVSNMGKMERVLIV